MAMPSWIRTPFLRSRAQWRALDRWTKAALLLILVAAYVGGVWLGSWYREWPVQIHLQRPGGAWPMTFSPDGQTFATSSPSGVTLWDVATGKERATWKTQADQGGHGIWRGRFSPDGQTFAVVMFGHPKPDRLQLIDVATGETRVTIPTQWNTLYHIAFVDQGRTLRTLMGDNDNGGIQEVATWDGITGQALMNKQVTCQTKVHNTTVSEDGRWLGIRSLDAKAIQVWDLDADREAIRLMVPPTIGTLVSGSLVFTSDARTLVAGLEDGSFLAWDVATGKVTSTFSGHQGGYVSWGLQITPDGRTLVSQGELDPASVMGGLQTLAGQALNGRNWSPPPEFVAVEFGTGRHLARSGPTVRPCLSRDGKWIATSDATSDGVAIRAMPGR